MGSRGDTKRGKLEDAVKGNAFGLCFKELMKFRYNGLCLRCSGKASDFYDNTVGGYKLKKSVCPKILEKCGSIYALIAETQKFAVLVEELSVGLGKPVNTKIKNVSLPEALIAKWATCGADATACSKGADVAALCATFTISQEANDGDELEAGMTQGTKVDAAPARLLTAQNGV